MRFSLNSSSDLIGEIFRCGRMLGISQFDIFIKPGTDLIPKTYLQEKT